MIRITSSRIVNRTMSTRPSTAPMQMKRSSVSECFSSRTTTRFRSKKASFADSKSTPCFAMFALSLLLSHSNFTFGTMPHNHEQSILLYILFYILLERFYLSHKATRNTEKSKFPLSSSVFAVPSVRALPGTKSRSSPQSPSPSPPPCPARRPVRIPADRP